MASISTEKILNFLKENHEEISRTELAEILGLSASSVNGALGGRYGLVAKGLVTERVEEITQPAVTEKEKAKEFAGKMTQLQKDLISYWRGRMLIYIEIVLIIILTWIFA